jgi:predicted TIM-barrel fold metal-dependent hydrolase
MTVKPEKKINRWLSVVHETDGTNTKVPMVVHDGERYRVCDAHTHFAGDTTRFDPTIRQIFERLQEKHRESGLSLRQVGRNPGALLDYLDSVGIDKAWVLAEEGPPTNYSVDSTLILGYCAQALGRLVPIGNLNPRIDRDIARRGESLIRAGIRGFKIYASDHNQDPRATELTPLYELCQAHRLPLMFHSGTRSRYALTNPKFGEAATWEALIRQYEAIPFVAAHGGKGGQQQDFLRLVQEYPNLFIEVSDLPFHTLEQHLSSNANIWDRYLFGTDMPQFANVHVLILKVLKLSIPIQAKHAILYDNAARLMGQVGD